jgi:hypothetical protein
VKRAPFDAAASRGVPPKLRREWPSWILALGALGVVALLFLTLASFSGKPSDEALVKQFREHRKEFELLREMMAKDSKIASVRDWGVSTNKWGSTPLEDAGIDEKRHTEYLGVLKRAGVKVAVRDEDEIRFAVAGSGFASKGYRIAVTYRETEPAPLLKSLDDFRKTKTESEHAYRKLDDRWYLWIIW